jgi:tetratricopeptide (TPR) repeat protein
VASTDSRTMYRDWVMTYRILLSGLSLIAFASEQALAQTSPPYIPGVTYQTDNPNYFKPNPFYFEGRIDWNLLNLTQPVNAWDYAQRGIHNQDDLLNTAAAITDYQTSISLNSLANGSCQIVTTNTKLPTSGPLNPPPCMFTVRLRLAGLLRGSNPQQAISLYNEVLQIDPLRLGVNSAIAETYVTMAEAATSPSTVQSLFQNAVTSYQAELALSPVTPLETQLTGDQANNAHVHWALADIYEKLGQSTNQLNELNLYLLATQWHSDTYPWRIALAQRKTAQLRRALRSAK